MPQVDSQTSANWLKTSPSSTFGTRDLAFYAIILEPLQQAGNAPFPITFLGETYNDVYVSSNGYISFGQGFSVFDVGDDATLDGANTAAILISETDNSYQYVYSKTTGDKYNGTREWTIRYVGSYGTSTTDRGDGYPDMIWEVTFYEALPGIVDLVVVNDARNAGGDGVSGVTDGSNWVDTFFGGNQYQGWGKGSYRIDTTDGTTAVVTPGTTLEKGERDMQIVHMYNHDTGGSTEEHGEDDDYVNASGCVWKGSDFSRAITAIQQVVELYYIGQPNCPVGVMSGINFVIAVSNDTANYNMIGNALFENYYGGYGGQFYIVPMEVGPQSIYAVGP